MNLMSADSVNDSIEAINSTDIEIESSAEVTELETTEEYETNENKRILGNELHFGTHYLVKLIFSKIREKDGLTAFFVKIIHNVV